MPALNCHQRCRRVPVRVTGYMVLYTDNADLAAEQWQMKSVDGPRTATSVGNLTLNVTYHLRVQARNSVGFSPLSSVALFYTEPLTIAPGLPPPLSLCLCLSLNIC